MSSTTVRKAKPSPGLLSIILFKSATGCRESYCRSSSNGTERAVASFARTSSEGNLRPSSTSERKGAETPKIFASSRSERSAASRSALIFCPRDCCITLSAYSSAQERKAQRDDSPLEPLSSQGNRGSATPPDAAAPWETASRPAVTRPRCRLPVVWAGANICAVLSRARTAAPLTLR